MVPVPEPPPPPGDYRGPAADPSPYQAELGLAAPSSGKADEGGRLEVANADVALLDVSQEGYVARGGMEEATKEAQKTIAADKLVILDVPAGHSTAVQRGSEDLSELEKDAIDVAKAPAPERAAKAKAGQGDTWADDDKPMDQAELRRKATEESRANRDGRLRMQNERTVREVQDAEMDGEQDDEPEEETEQTDEVAEGEAEVASGEDTGQARDDDGVRDRGRRTARFHTGKDGAGLKNKPKREEPERPDPVEVRPASFLAAAMARARRAPRRGVLLPDAWCASWFWPARQGADLPLAPATVASLAERLGFLHWGAAFPAAVEAGGFDAVVGNPP